jgi:hypothetical protein
MTPAAFQTFFATSAGAGAALVGLLFVAVSISPERVFGHAAQFDHQLVASSAFTALVNAFFISMGAIIPSSNFTGVAVVVLVMGSIALVNSAALTVNLVRRTAWEVTLRSALLVLAGLVIYGLEVWNAVLLLRAPSSAEPMYSLCGLLIGVYGFGVVRAWQLLGAERKGVISFIVPLVVRTRAPRDSEPVGATDAHAASLASRGDPHGAE